MRKTVDRYHTDSPPEQVLDFDLTQNTVKDMMRDVLPHITRAPRTAPGALSRSIPSTFLGNSGSAVRPSPVAPILSCAQVCTDQNPKGTQ